MTDDSRPALFARIVTAAPAAPCAAATALLVYLWPDMLLAAPVALPVAMAYKRRTKAVELYVAPAKSVYPTTSWTDDELEQLADSSREPDDRLEDFADEYLGRTKSPESQQIVNIAEVDLTTTVELDQRRDAGGPVRG